MISRRTALGLIASAFAPTAARAALAEPDFLNAKVSDGSLPPMAERLPQVPRVVDLTALGRAPGRYGGTARMLVGGQKDIRYMTINGYSRLVGYDTELNLQPDILQGYENEGSRVFTFHLRPGHRWSDGHPFTTEDFRHYWEDVLLNKALRKGGPPIEMISGGKPPRVEIIDEVTLRYSWDEPNPEFLEALAGASPLVLALPFHYMRQFHERYQTPEKLAELIKQNRVEEWDDLYTKKSRTYRPENPDLPTLEPWRPTVAPPAEQFVFERNPYFHRVDERGQQLPYVDRVVLNVGSDQITAAKTGAGETDLQIIGLDFVDYTFLKAAEKIHPVKVRLWERTQGSAIALLPNLNVADDTWRTLFRDVRVRRALSLAIDRHEINMVSFYGLARESADTVLPQSPLFKPEYANAWSSYDPEQASTLLDAAGLDKRGRDGVRLLPDGRPMQLIVETSGGGTLETDVLQLVADNWREIGISPYVRVSQRDIFRSRAMGGEVMMSVWGGLDNGVPTPEMSPAALAPTADDQLQWPLWGLYYYSRGNDGHPPDLAEAEELLDLFKAWSATGDAAEHERIWHQMLQIRADQVFTIGIVNGAQQPIVTAASLRNIPDKALYGFAPTAYLGVYLPDTFWYDRSL